MLEKGKGHLLGKLRTITLIEGDLQMIMRMHLDSEKEEFMKQDSRFSKIQYRSRKKYTIETVLLEKRLMFDRSMSSTKPTTCALTDLKSCYNSQLPSISSIIEELVEKMD